MSQKVQFKKKDRPVRKMHRAEELDLQTEDLLHNARKARHRARTLIQEVEVFLNGYCN